MTKRLLGRSSRLPEIRRLCRRIVDFLDEQLRSGQEAGAPDTVDPGTVTAILSLGIEVVPWHRCSPSSSPEALGALYGELVVGMVSLA